MKKLYTTVICMALFTGSNMLHAEGGPHDKAIEARQAVMQLYGYHMGILGAMAKGKIDYNAELAAESAHNLLAVNSLGQSTLWPAGSDDSDPQNTENRALASIWEDFPKVAEKGKDMHEAIVALSAIAGNGLDELKDSFAAVGKACKGCHDDFRAEKK